MVKATWYSYETQIGKKKCDLCGEPAEYGIGFNTLDGRCYCICLGCLEHKVHPVIEKERKRAESDGYKEIHDMYGSR